MKWLVLIILFVTPVFGGRPRIPQPKTPDEVHQNDQDLIDRIEDLSRRTSQDPQDLTIASGVISIARHFHTVDVQTGSTDDVDTINGGKIGDIIVLQAKSSARDIVIKDGTGNLDTAGDFTMDNVSDKIMLIRISTSAWHEITRSGNGA